MTMTSSPRWRFRRRARAASWAIEMPPVWIDEERDLLHRLRAGDQLFEIGFGDLAAPDLRGRDLRLFGNDTGGELFRRHFEREEADDAAIGSLERAVGLLRRLVGVGDVEGDVGDQRGLAHAGTAGQHDQVGGLQAAHALVEVAQAGGNAGKMAVAHEGGVGHVDGEFYRVGEAFEAAVVAAGFGEFEQTPFGILDLL